jgi:predicted AAA+ superfamily ATPase
MSKKYFDVELQRDRLRADREWDALIRSRDLVIFDEAQTWPEVFMRLREAIEEDPARKGRFLLAGSVSCSWMSPIIELTPLLLGELPPTTTLDSLWLYGGYPDGGLMDSGRFPKWQLDYLALMAQRELPNCGMPAWPDVTDRLFRITAALHGQIWNSSRVAQSLRLTYHTVNTYLDFFERAFLVRRLEPYQASTGKRLVQRPRVYWRDSGLLHALLNAGEQNLLEQPWAEASWRSFVIEQILGAFSVLGKVFQPYYFRTSDRHEIDLVLESENELWAIDIKLTPAPGLDDINRLNKTADMIGAKRRFLISRTTRSVEDTQRGSLNLLGFIDLLKVCRDFAN